MKPQLRVLCVDEDEACGMLSAILGFSGVEVKAADCFAEALRLAQSEFFDLYLLETRLPGGDGFELCRRLHEFDSQTPIIFYSGDAQTFNRQKGLAAGAAAYLVKPYLDSLTAAVSQIITDKEKPAPTIDLPNVKIVVRPGTAYARTN